jgi:hypothetical protein
MRAHAPPDSHEVRAWDNPHFRKNLDIFDLFAVADEDQEVVRRRCCRVVDRPSCFSRQSFDIDGHGVSCMSDDGEINGLLVAQCEHGIQAEAMQSGKDVELGGQIGVVALVGHGRPNESAYDRQALKNR